MTIATQMFRADRNDEIYFKDCISLSFTYLSAALEWWAYFDSFIGERLNESSYWHSRYIGY